MIFLTVGEVYSGVYHTQVIETCSFIQKITGEKITILAFVPFRLFFKNRKIINLFYRNSIVVPMVPFLIFWQLNIFILFVYCIIRGERVIIARSLLAGWLAAKLKKLKVVKFFIYDARAAAAAEFLEFPAKMPNYLIKNAYNWENYVVKTADILLAVSSKIIDYWKKYFNYNGNNFKVIPSCVYFEKASLPSEADISNLRKQFGYEPHEVIIFFEEGGGEWQSPHEITLFTKKVLINNKNINIMFLTKDPQKYAKIIDAAKKMWRDLDFSKKIRFLWLSPQEVRKTMAIGDYGLMLRSPTLSILCQSPVKIAEYLSCGLRLIVNPIDTDYFQIITKSNLGITVENLSKTASLPIIDYSTKVHIRQIASDFYSREAYEKTYKEIFELVQENLGNI